MKKTNTLKSSHHQHKTEKQETVDLTAMTVEELTAFAKDKGIDIGQATSQEGIIKKIRAALEACFEA